MPDRELSAEDKEELRKLDLHETFVAESRAKILEKYGMKGSSTIATKIKKEDDDSTLFARLTAEERIQLRKENPEEWDRLRLAYQARGDRLLFGGTL